MITPFNTFFTVVVSSVVIPFFFMRHGCILSLQFEKAIHVSIDGTAPMGALAARIASIELLDQGGMHVLAIAADSAEARMLGKALFCIFPSQFPIDL
jgi:hypothetical protein